MHFILHSFSLKLCIATIDLKRSALHCTAYRKVWPNQMWEWWTMLLLTIPQSDTEEERSALSKAELLLNGGSKVQLLWSGNEDWQRQQTRQGHGWGHTRTPPSSSYTLLVLPHIPRRLPMFAAKNGKLKKNLKKPLNRLYRLRSNMAIIKTNKKYRALKTNKHIIFILRNILNARYHCYGHSYS